MLDAEEGKKDNDEFLATYCSYFEVHVALILCVLRSVFIWSVCLNSLCLA